MATKISIYKGTADGEQTNIEIELTKEHFDAMQPRTVKKYDGTTEIIPGKTLRQIFNYAFELADDRLLEMNKRIMASNVMVKRLPPEAQFAIHNIFEILHGRSQGPAAEQILEEDKREREAVQEQGRREQLEEAIRLQQVVKSATQSANTDVPE